MKMLSDIKSEEGWRPLCYSIILSIWQDSTPKKVDIFLISYNVRSASMHPLISLFWTCQEQMNLTGAHSVGGYWDLSSTDDSNSHWLYEELFNDSLFTETFPEYGSHCWRLNVHQIVINQFQMWKTQITCGGLSFCLPLRCDSWKSV